jgi:PAS domain S-box-containing protein
LEVDIICKDGTIRCLQVFGKSLLWNGKMQTQTFYNDITERKQAEESLATIEQNFHNSLDYLPMGFRITDVDDNTLYLNQAFLNIFGYENIDEVKTNPPLKHYTAESYAGYLQRKERLSRGKPRQERVEVDIVRKDGVIRHLQLSTGELVWNGKKQFQTLYNDITEKRKTEMALIKSEQNLKEAQRVGGIGCWELDITTGEVEWSDEFYRLYERDKALGPRNPDEETKFYSPEQNKMFREYARRAVKNGEEFNYDLTANLPSGKITLFNTTLHPVKDDKGRVIKLFGTVQDITERKRAEEALKLSEQNFRNSMDGSFMGIYIVDTDWHILYVNQAFLDIFGYKNIDEVRASPPHEHYTPEEYARHLVRNERRLHGEPNPDQFELDILHKDGTIRHLQAFRKEVLWDGKQQSQLLYNDITERKVIEEALKESETMYHELMNTITSGVFIYKAVDNGENFVCVDVNNSAEKMEGINLQISSASG